MKQIWTGEEWKEIPEPEDTEMEQTFKDLHHRSKCCPAEVRWVTVSETPGYPSPHDRINLFPKDMPNLESMFVDVRRNGASMN